ncbi:MAG: 50S ribosomal protein L20 [Deltaproteobacteria bacterium RIFCSPLOWO2_02_FULL_50_16]|nr:MAG: 50S ribosomal protein L20 [Deltaproteobacteria bacterium GWA2_50_8]OGQ25720.1 MAG: 50S ribosomal protein L20 [Deltaproteobacteria bacterium RIFCSPHIGHO2_02_FULL_50_15]OGQ56983.1 MAG: 50S ribosomal protein L20 [Deltaproteobacteria bacterium RIFCSPLOWO2_02_FULL_50_16]OGQ68061.1 MAG: 50S ribosomal protein L20 [Deltaproteobacteria bacterium RIFCSPLOWO2_12_FULL_50_11]
MPRAKRGVKARRRRNKILKMAKGYRGGKSRLIRTATEMVHKALQYSYRDRKVRKRKFRSLWNIRIGVAAKNCGSSYSKLIGALKKANIGLDRKILAELAVHDPEGFKKVVEVSKGASE